MTTEFRTVRVPANPKKQTKELNKLANDGWHVVQVKHVLGAGMDRAYLQRERTEKVPTAPAKGDSFMERLFKRMEEDNKREAEKRREARELKKQAKLAAKADKR